MDLGLKGKVAFVAAGSQGLGKACAFELAKEGVKVAICGRTEATLNQTAQEIETATGQEILTFVADVTNPDDVKTAIEFVVGHWGGLHILVTNAGGAAPGYFDDLDDAKWEAGWRLNFLSVVQLIRAALPHLKQNNWGRIVTITSASVKQPIDDLLISSAVRPGVVGLVRSLATQLGKDGITVNNVAPGFTKTERITQIFSTRAEQKGSTLEQEIATATSNNPVGRIGQPDELGALVTFLASERAGYINGQTIVIDGGTYRGLA